MLGSELGEADAEGPIAYVPPVGGCQAGCTRLTGAANRSTPWPGAYTVRGTAPQSPAGTEKQDDAGEPGSQLKLMKARIVVAGPP